MGRRIFKMNHIWTSSRGASGKLNTQNALDLTLTHTCGHAPTVSHCGSIFGCIFFFFFFGLSPLLAHTVLVMLMNLQISLMVVGLKRLAQLFFLKVLS